MEEKEKSHMLGNADNSRDRDDSRSMEGCNTTVLGALRPVPNFARFPIPTADQVYIYIYI